jgi:hypothetical protein
MQVRPVGPRPPRHRRVPCRAPARPREAGPVTAQTDGRGRSRRATGASCCAATLRQHPAQRASSSRSSWSTTARRHRTPAPCGPRAGDRVRVIRNDRSRGVGAARNQGAAADGSRGSRSATTTTCGRRASWRGSSPRLRASARVWAYTGAVKFERGPRCGRSWRPPTPAEVHARLPTKNVIPAGASNVLVAGRASSASAASMRELAHLADWDLWLRLREVGPPAAAPGDRRRLPAAPRRHVPHPAGILDDLARSTPGGVTCATGERSTRDRRTCGSR